MVLPIDYLIVKQGLYISYTALWNIEEVGPPAKWHDAKLVKYLKDTRPLRVFQGLKRDNLTDAKCSVYLPDFRHDNDGNQITPRAGRLFLVFSELKMFGDVVFDWEWRPGNEKTGYPFNWQDDFSEEVQ